MNFSRNAHDPEHAPLGTVLSYTTTTTHHKTAADAPGAEHQQPVTFIRPSERPPSLAGAVWSLLVFLGMLAILGRIVWLLAHG